MKTGITAAALLLAALGASTIDARAEWVRCASENGYCRVPYPTTVRYGAAGSYAEVRADGGVPCNNRIFGDPAEGRRKACFFDDRRGGRPPMGDGGWGGPPPGGGWGGGWQPCAAEGGYCNVGGGAMVRYGARGSYITRRVRGGIDCSNWAFGGDPADGVRKHCEMMR